MEDGVYATESFLSHQMGKGCRIVTIVKNIVSSALVRSMALQTASEFAKCTEAC